MEVDALRVRVGSGGSLGGAGWSQAQDHGQFPEERKDTWQAMPSSCLQPPLAGSHTHHATTVGILVGTRRTLLSLTLGPLLSCLHHSCPHSSGVLSSLRHST